MCPVHVSVQVRRVHVEVNRLHVEVRRVHVPVRRLHVEVRLDKKKSNFDFKYFLVASYLNCLRFSFLGLIYGVVVSMFVFHSSDQDSNPGRGGKIS